MIKNPPTIFAEFEGRTTTFRFGTDEIYSEAIDVESANYEYVETSVKIEEEKVEESV